MLGFLSASWGGVVILVVEFVFKEQVKDCKSNRRSERVCKIEQIHTNPTMSRG